MDSTKNHTNFSRESVKAAVISLGSKSSQMTIDELKKLFDTVDNIQIKKVEVTLGSKELELIYEGKPLSHYDCVYVKGSFRFANLARTITSILAKRGTYLPLKASAFTVGHDKLLTHVKLQANNVPMPLTYLTATSDAAKELLHKVCYPIVMKLPSGTHGKGVMFAESYSSATSLFDALTVLNQPFIIQEYIETGGEDIRAIVVGDKVVASMKRKAVTGEKRANIHAGGKGEPCELDAKTKKIAIDAAQAVGLGICAVDIVESARGPLVIEVNVSPGLQGITKATGINVAEKISKYLFEETKKLKEITSGKKIDNVMKEIGIQKAGHEIVSNLTFRGDKILLPEIVTKITKFNDKEEYLIKLDTGKLVIKKQLI